MTRGRLFLRACRSQLSAAPGQPPLHHNLRAAYEWLCSAQDASGDGGVAGWYDLLRGWAASYPETTGYIIPTFLAYAAVCADPEARRRAIQMADFETAVQLPSGAVRSGVLGATEAPAVFNTGQVLFGWIAACQAGKQEYAQAAARAARWLISRQDDDGAWRTDLSPLTTSAVQTYNVRAAWGLAMAGHVLAEPRWINAARKNTDWALKQQLDNGWFAQNAFSDHETPLLHTIGYALEGVLGMGELLEEEKYIAAAASGAAPLVRIFLQSGCLRGRYDQNWRATVKWRCLTGEAQIALVLYRLSRRLGKPPLAGIGRALLERISAIQDRAAPFEIRGGIPGSAPLWGGYCPFKYINWAAKFYMDAMLLHLYRADVQKSCSLRAAA